MKFGDLITPKQNLKWVPLMSDHLETQVDVHKTLYGANIDIVRFHEGETAVVVEVNDDLTERRVRVLFKGGFWWATAAEIRVL